MVAPESIEGEGYWEDIEDADASALGKFDTKEPRIKIPDIVSDHKVISSLSAVGLLGVSIAIGSTIRKRHKAGEE